MTSRCECGAAAECLPVWHEALAAEQADPQMALWHNPLVCAFVLQHRSQLRPRFADGDISAIAASIASRVDTYHHPAGTCHMGPDPGDGAVVDARGRVHGIDHLQVADASIMPAIPSANTNLPTIMIAERVAPWITAKRHRP